MTEATGPFDPDSLADADAALREIAVTGKHTTGTRALRRALEYVEKVTALSAELVTPPAPPQRPRGKERCAHNHPTRGRCTADVGHPKGRGGGHHYLDEVSEDPATVRPPKRFHEGLPSMVG